MGPNGQPITKAKEIEAILGGATEKQLHIDLIEPPPDESHETQRGSDAVAHVCV